VHERVYERVHVRGERVRTEKVRERVYESERVYERVHGRCVEGV
jgi:hypothetical protein